MHPVFILFLVIFRNGTGAEGFQQVHQVVHLGQQAAALIGVGNLHAGVHLFEDQGIVGDIVVFVNGIVFAGEDPGC